MQKPPAREPARTTPVRARPAGTGPDRAFFRSLSYCRAVSCANRAPSRSPESHAACIPPPGENRSPTIPIRETPTLSSIGPASSFALSSREYRHRWRCVHAGDAAQGPRRREAMSRSSLLHSSFGRSSLFLDHDADACRTRTRRVRACGLLEDSLPIRRRAGSSSG